VLRKRVAVLVAAAVMVLSMLAASAPVFAAPPDCFPGQGSLGSNCGVAAEHRANPSGKGNFGQCHTPLATSALQGFVDLRGQQSSVYNPSPHNTGEADCRSISGRDDLSAGGIALANCDLGEEPFAEVLIIYQPTLGTPGLVRAGCL
jgi:hypothetical protein